MANRQRVNKPVQLVACLAVSKEGMSATKGKEKVTGDLHELKDVSD